MSNFTVILVFMKSHTSSSSSPRVANIYSTCGSGPKSLETRVEFLEIMIFQSISNVL